MHRWTVEKHPVVVHLQGTGVGQLHIAQGFCVIEDTAKVNLDTERMMQSMTTETELLILMAKI